MAHELRTPLQVIQGNLEGVLDDVYEPTEEHIASTLEETLLLGRLVEDLGPLSLAESGQLSLTTERMDVRAFLADVATAFKAHAEAAGIQLSVEDAEEQDGLTVQADVGRMQQVLGNLVNNALHHTESGGRIALGTDADQGSVRIRVEDTGSGIPEEDLPLIFDRFWRGERSRSRVTTAGGGLGLAIARQLVHANGGRISATSEVGRGTTFTIELAAADTGGAGRGATLQRPP